MSSVVLQVWFFCTFRTHKQGLSWGWLIAELRHRSVRIFKPTRNTMQSGGAKGEKWRIDFDILQGSGRWENPQMGWASSYVVLTLTKSFVLLTKVLYSVNFTTL